MDVEEAQALRDQGLSLRQIARRRLSVPRSTLANRLLPLRSSVIMGTTDHAHSPL